MRGCLGKVRWKHFSGEPSAAMKERMCILSGSRKESKAEIKVLNVTIATLQCCLPLVMSAVLKICRYISYRQKKTGERMT